MTPALNPSDQVLVWCWGTSGERDVVVAKKGHLYLIKRVRYRHKGQYFLSSDNPRGSQDSRQLGWFDYEDVVGRVFFVRRAGEGE